MSEETKKKISATMKGKLKSKETRIKMSMAQLGNKKSLGKSMSAEAKMKISMANKGRVRDEKARENMSNAQLGKTASEETRRKLSLLRKGRKFSEEHRRRIAESKLGPKSHLWKGGITHLHKQIRQSIEYRLWREAVFKRDNFTCVWCKQKGIMLNADHIKPFSQYPELRFSIDNGRTLCVPCHKTTITYGRKKI